MILKGETYHRQTGIFEGEPYTNKMHAERHGAMCELRKLDRFAVEDGFEPYSFGRGSYEDKFDAPPWMPQAAKAARGDTLPTGNSAS
jgi:hypothetical protein